MKKSSIILGLKIFFLVTPLFGCSKKDNILFHGYTFNDVHNIDQIIIKMNENRSSRSEVTQLLGSPSLIETIEDQAGNRRYTFFYTEDTFMKKPYIGDKKLRTKVLKIDFGYDDKVQDVSFETISDHKKFDNSLKTSMKGNKMSFLDQMQKNLTSQAN